MELKLRVAAHADTLHVGDEVAASSTANWWAHQTRQDRPATFRSDAARPSPGDRLFEPVRVGLAGGDVNVDQALVIVGAVEDLPDDLDPVLAAKAVEVLVAEAAHLAPRSYGSSAKGSSPPSLLRSRTPSWRRSSPKRNVTPPLPPASR